jgi:protein-S-isoprenylcysteine O-methyltransferase Ste14
MRALLVSSLAGLLWGIFSLGDFDAFGIQALLSHLKPRGSRPVSLTIRGPYRWVRHPLYTSGLVALWACSSMSADRLLANLLLSSWILAGTLWEERDLLADFGDAYRRYQRHVPMLLPWRRFLLLQSPEPRP